MVAGSITDEVTVTVAAERLWRVPFADNKSVLLLLPKACASYVEAVEIKGDGGLGSITTMKLYRSLGGAKALKSRVVVFDLAVPMVKMEVLEGVSHQLKSQASEFKMEAASEGATVFKVKVEYKSIDGAEARLSQCDTGLVKMIEAYLVEYARDYVHC